VSAGNQNRHRRVVFQPENIAAKTALGTCISRYAQRQGDVEDTQSKFACKGPEEPTMLQSRRYFMHLLAALSLTGVINGASAADTTQVLLKTNMGDIVLELYPAKAPKTVANFLQYVKSGHYNGTSFHRVIDNFMIQGGGFDKDMQQKPTNAPIENEANNGLKNDAYTIAMARTSAPNSATAQFFINIKNNRFLDYPGQDGWGYCVFGKVVKGTDVVDHIKSVDTTNSGMFQNVPVKAVVIESAAVVK
jgi:peptidyl-prolyl cis-trans isomerase A (cyclophilin A)/peptidyl-prolyl cis-trans isomerase B (cyclophilin B)